jgi:hypothetical protein
MGHPGGGVRCARVGGRSSGGRLVDQPQRAEGLDAALKTLAIQPFGPGLLVAVAVGLTSFGLLCFFDARYHRV